MGVTLLKRKGCAKIERQVNIYFTDLCNSYNKIWMDIDRAKVGKSPTDYRQCIELYGSAIAKIDKSKQLIKALQEAINNMGEYIKQYDAIYNDENISQVEAHSLLHFHHCKLHHIVLCIHPCY